MRPSSDLADSVARLPKQLADGRAAIAAMSDDRSVVQFKRPDPEELPPVLMCDEGAELRELYARNCAAAGARLRIADRERLARLRGVKIARPELRVVEGPESLA